MKKSFRQLISFSSIYAVGTISERAILFIFLPVLTAFLDPAEFGLIALCMLATNVFTKLTSPFLISLNRFYFNPDLFQKRAVMLWNLFIYLCAKTSILFFLFILLAGLFAKMVDDNENSILLFRIFSFVILLNPIENFLKVLIRLEQKAQFFVTISILQITLFCLTLILFLTVFDLGVFSIPIAVSLRSLCGVIFFLPFFLRCSIFELKPALIKEPLSYGYTLIISAYSNLFLQSADRFIIGMLTSLSLVGVYDVGYRIASVIDFSIVMPLKQALHPIVFKQENQPDNLKYFVMRSATAYYFFSLFLGLVICLWAKELVILLARQESYHSAWIIIPFIVFSYIQHGLGNFLGIGMMLRKKAGVQSTIIIITASINIILNFILIQWIGLIGAAIATVVAYIFWNILKAYFSWIYDELIFEYRRIFFLTILWIVFVSFGNIFTTESFFLLFGYKFSLLLAFPILLIFGGFFMKDEKAQLIKIFYLISRYFQNFFMKKT